MTQLAMRLGHWIDTFWQAIGLDFHGFSMRHPKLALELGVWCLAIGQTVGYACLYYIFAALLLTWDSALGWDKGLLTFAFMLAILTGAAMSPLAGRLVDHGRSRWLLSGGMWFGALALLALGFAQSYPVFLICWLVLGVAQGASLYEPCFAFLTRTTGENATRNITKVTLVAGFASTLAFPAGAFLANAYGWQVATWAFAAAAGLIGAPLLFAGATMIECCPQDTHTPEAKARNRDAVRTALRRPEFWLIFAAFPLIGLTEGLILTHIIPILTASGLSLAQAVFAAALFGPMQVVGRLAMMALAGRVSALGMATLSFVGILGAVLLLMVVEDIPQAAYAFALLFGASYGLISILKPVVTAEVLGRTGFGAIAGLMAVPFLISLAVSPQIGSWLERIGGGDLALYDSAATACLAMLALFALTVLLRLKR